MHSLLEVLGVDDGPDFAVVVGGPVGLGDFGSALAGVDTVVVVLAVVAREPGLSLFPTEVELEGVVGRGESSVQVVLGVQLVLEQKILKESWKTWENE